MAPINGQGRSKGKKLAPKTPAPKNPKRPLDQGSSSSDEEDSLAEQQVIMAQLAAMEQECGISPGGGLSPHGTRLENRQLGKK